MFNKLAIQSLLNRKLSVALTVIALTVSMFVLLAVQQIKQQSKQSFNRSISGVELIVGAPTGQLNLLLSSVFHIGYLSKGISWQSYQQISSHPQVKWTVPLSLGDSHKGFRVVGTNQHFYEYFKYGNKQSLNLKTGKWFSESSSAQTQQVVLGAKVAQTLNYKVGDNLILSHGLGEISFSHHDNVNFVVSGIFTATGTPIDQSLYVSLAGIELMHDDQVHDQKVHVQKEHDEHEHQNANHEHDQEHQGENIDNISAMLVGVNAKYATLFVQKFVNDFSHESLMAIVPGVALTELWRLLSSIENMLLVVSWLVLISSLIGMTTMLLSSLRERRREFAIFRSLGATSGFIFWLIELEVMLITFVSTVLAIVCCYGGALLAKPWLASQYNVFIEPVLIPTNSEYLLLAIWIMSLIVGVIPALSAYKQTLRSALTH
mgnify:CR=1 FL=1